MNVENRNASKWQRTKEQVKSLVQKAPMAILGVLSFSLFFMFGLVILGMSLMAGIVAIIMAKYQQRQVVKDIPHPQSTTNQGESVVTAAEIQP
ncbi:MULTISPECIES: hypothetical protein [unclassified Salinivibrio]|jgi:hypothetical protein|uniref:hypothetical protein n=1 Tax=unclassified Salinivibrio TaxID=2636825 RepID=UPI0009872F73|nr:MULTISPECIES: hypothetical protein [unclassified Salinivibrio]OOE93400.1 hypothetical protein BZG76_05245 [Salinivibrio sp. AR647]OOE94925.1 hypothetical protein BZG75_04815 [Salinivibrio sp. AR640]